MRSIRGFKEIVYLWVFHFKSMYKGPKREHIENIVKFNFYFPKFIYEEPNEKLIFEIWKEERKLVTNSFQKDKILGSNVQATNF